MILISFESFHQGESNGSKIISLYKEFYLQLSILINRIFLNNNIKNAISKRFYQRIF
jgi:hypothetical protein